MLLPISENISLLIKLHRGEQNGTKFSVSFYRCHNFLYDVWSLKYKISIMTENIYVIFYYNALQLLPKNCFGHILFLHLYFKNNFLWKLTVLLSSCVGNQTSWWTTQMSYSVSLYSKSRKLLQFLFLLPRWRLPWRCVSIWTLHNTLVTFCNLRLAFRQL